MPWRKNPVIYEINTRLWLKDLSLQYGKPIHLGTIPLSELEKFANNGIDAIWLMGVWNRSLEGIEIAHRHPGLQEEYTRALGTWGKKDIGASPYAIRVYEVAQEFGNDQTLAIFRSNLLEFDIKLILDFVPNHMAIDTPFLYKHPDLFLQDTPSRAEPKDYFQRNVRGIPYTFAHGKDPYFPSWTDTVQVDYSEVSNREFMADLMEKAASHCDGLRCDMAQLVTPNVFKKTWGKSFDKDETFWKPAIQSIKYRRPGFVFMAEVYWGLEWELQQEGFDFTYDKTLYDRLRYSTPDDVRGHLGARFSYQNKLVRFIENHDETRAVKAFDNKAEAAALIASTTPGAKLFHDGQFEGKSIRLPIQLTRKPADPVNHDIIHFYQTLLQEIKDDIYHKGDWKLLEVSSVGDDTNHNIIAYEWTMQDRNKIVAVNLGNQESHAYIRPSLPSDKNECILVDHMTNKQYKREVSEVSAKGLFIKLAPYEAHVFDVR
ncbi:MAG: alpha-amylase family glycosyl hydrolase [Pseudomonadota bacterium]